MPSSSAKRHRLETSPRERDCRRLCAERECRGRRSDILWPDIKRPVSPGGHLRGPDPEGREASRPSGRALALLALRPLSASVKQTERAIEGYDLRRRG